MGLEPTRIKGGPPQNKVLWDFKYKDWTSYLPPKTFEDFY